MDCFLGVSFILQPRKSLTECTLWTRRMNRGWSHKGIALVVRMSKGSPGMEWRHLLLFSRKTKSVNIFKISFICSLMLGSSICGSFIFKAPKEDCCCRALKAGLKAPLIVTLPHKKYPQAELVAALGAMQELYVPLNVREEEKKVKVTAVGLYALDYDQKVSWNPTGEISVLLTNCREEKVEEELGGTEVGPFLLLLYMAQNRLVLTNLWTPYPIRGIPTVGLRVSAEPSQVRSENVNFCSFECIFAMFFFLNLVPRTVLGLLMAFLEVPAACLRGTAACFGDTPSGSGGHLQRVSEDLCCVFRGVLATCSRDLLCVFRGLSAYFGVTRKIVMGLIPIKRRVRLVGAIATFQGQFFSRPFGSIGRGLGTCKRH